jgi:hypothetical protein
MSKINPYILRMEISRMFESGQSFFATIKVQDWLKERQYNPDDYEIIFHQQPAPPGSGKIIDVAIELRRKDGQPTDSWLQEEANRYI